jgi:hypothetical protein
MVQAFQHANSASSALIPLLARLAAADVPPSRQSLADSLSQWLDWTNAIALSTALSAAGSGDDDASASDASIGAAERECVRVRTSLANAITGDSALAATKPRKHATSFRTPPHAGIPTDFASFRHICISRQQAMETAIATLRGLVRDRVASTSSGMKQLVMVDAAMERALAHRERTLLSGIPALLSARFNALRHAAQIEPATPGDATADSFAWLDTFRHDMQAVLLAELDLRFQPVDGLLAALRAS